MKLFISLLLFAAIAHASISVVNSTGATWASGTTWSPSFTAITTGNLLVQMSGAGASTPHVTTPNGTTLNATWGSTADNSSATNRNVEIWHGTSPTGGATSNSQALSGTPGTWRVITAELLFGNGFNSLLTTSTPATGTSGTNVNIVQTITPAAGKSAIFIAFTRTSGTAGAATGTNCTANPFNTANTGWQGAYCIIANTSGGSYSLTWNVTSGSAITYEAVGAAYDETAGGGGSVTAMPYIAYAPDRTLCPKREDEYV